MTLKKNPTASIDNPQVQQAYQSLPETRNGDWQEFRLNTIAKLIDGVQEPNGEIFDALENWMYTVNKGPDLETILET
jgi:hypothetical protein